MLKAHLDRFFLQQNFFFKYLNSFYELKKIIYQGIKKNKGNELYIKIILTGGKSDDGIILKGKGSFLISFIAVKSYSSFYFEKGVEVISFKNGVYRNLQLITEVKRRQRFGLCKQLLVGFS